ncbi:MAG: hypothetical protein NTY96_07420 [Bacteroidetes bacterium]|nr:hypothetical protein [Bacteroidota bacterium]
MKTPRPDSRFTIHGSRFTILVTLLLAFFASGCSKSSDSGDTPAVTCTWKTAFSDDFTRSDTLVGTNYQVIITPTPYGGHGSAYVKSGTLWIVSDSVFWALIYTHTVDGSKSRVSIDCTTPASGGTPAFAVGGKFTSAGTGSQSGYFAAAMQGGLGIYKIVNGSMTTLATQTYPIEFNRTYRISLTIDGGSLTAVITNLFSGSGITLSTTDTGTILSGNQYSINGNSLGGQVTLLFDNYLIEACQ